MEWRAYDAAKDREAVHRIWKEGGWNQPDNPLHEERLDLMLAASHPVVAQLNGTAECAVIMTPGEMRYLETDLLLACVRAVTTSRVAKRQGLAKRLTAHAVAREAENGAEVSALGMFDQGFYNLLGFGTSAYSHLFQIDPAHLDIDARFRPPRRLSADDFEEVHACRVARRRVHGSCILIPPKMTRADMLASKNAFGLGYCDAAGGSLSHGLWINPANAGPGPYWVACMAYRNTDQLKELLALLAGMGDQVHLVKLLEPPGICLQDLLRNPLRELRGREEGSFKLSFTAYAVSQARLLDLPKCLAKTHLRCDELRFNLSLSDPIDKYLDDSATWRGTGGDYVVTLGADCRAEKGAVKDLPTLRASVNAFSRMWLGAVPATGLSVTDELDGPPELLEALDWAFRLPAPHFDWPF
ncbi:MAG: GNAT family N-acetyltransferase [Candidatus Hydrogenedentes bacterium]|nr:GNAT family N-acetyltransferase [Candidatus Hydrogenedentota bacterium]